MLAYAHTKIDKPRELTSIFTERRDATFYPSDALADQHATPTHTHTHRFNHACTLAKVRYLNVACLLLTLVCLAIIILLSGGRGGNNNNNNNTVGSSAALSTSPAAADGFLLTPLGGRSTASAASTQSSASTTTTTTTTTGGNKTDSGSNNDNNDDEESLALVNESIDSLNKQSLVGDNSAASSASAQHATAVDVLGSSGSDEQDSSAADAIADSHAAVSTRHRSSVKRHNNNNKDLESEDAETANDSLAQRWTMPNNRRLLSKLSNGEREIEGADLSDDAPTLFTHRRSLFGGPPSDEFRPEPWSAAPISPLTALLGPILSASAGSGDSDSFDSLLRSMRHGHPTSSSSSSAAQFIVSRPIVRRNSNGATIIFSSPSIESRSDAASPLSGLIERLLMPSPLRRRESTASSSSSSKQDTNDSPSLASAVIAIGAQPIASFSSHLPLVRPPFAINQQRGSNSDFAPAAMWRQHSSPFNPSPFAGLMSPLDFALPSPHTMISMLMRAGNARNMIMANSDIDDDIDLDEEVSRLTPTDSFASAHSNNTAPGELQTNITHASLSANAPAAADASSNFTV